MKKSLFTKPKWFNDKHYGRSKAERYIISFDDLSITRGFDDQLNCIKILFGNDLILGKPGLENYSESWFEYFGGNSDFSSAVNAGLSQIKLLSCANYFIESGIDPLYGGYLALNIDRESKFMIDLFYLTLNGGFYYPPLFYSVDSERTGYYHNYNEIGLFLHSGQEFYMSKLIDLGNIKITDNNYNPILNNYKN